MSHEEEKKETHKIDLSSPDCHEQLADALAARTVMEMEIEIPDDHLMRNASEEILKGNLMISGIVVIRIKVQPVKLATYRDPITHRKAGHAPQYGGRKKSFPYPDASIPDDALSVLEWRFGSCNPATLRMIALLAEPGSIQAGGDSLVLRSLISQAQLAMRAFKINRLRKPFQRFIDALEKAITRLPEIRIFPS